MVPQIIWSPRALSDLHDIAAYIGKSSPLTAEKFCLRLIDHVESLPAFPEKGRTVPDSPRPGLRELISPPYRIAYEISADRSQIQIMTVWHSARGSIEL